MWPLFASVVSLDYEEKEKGGACSLFCKVIRKLNTGHYIKKWAFITNYSEMSVKNYSYKCDVTTKMLKTNDLLSCILQMPEH